MTAAKKHYNPAGRLHSILLTARSGPANEPIKASFKRAFQAVDDGELFRKLGMTMELSDEVKRLILQQPSLDHDEHLSWYPRIRNFLALNLAKEQYPLLGEDLKALRFCSLEIEKHKQENEIPEADLRELLAEIESLSNTTLGCSIDKQLKLWLLDRLNAIRRAVQDYAIRGSEGITEAVVASYPVFSAAISESGDSTIDSGVRNFLKKSWEIMKNARTAHECFLFMKDVAALFHNNPLLPR